MFITTDEELAFAVERMRMMGTDLAEFELKSASGGIPKTIGDTISAFSNTSGGVMVFGIAEKGGFHSGPNLDVKVIQAHCAQAARELVMPPQAVDIRALAFEGNPVVVVNVPEAPVKEKPCFLKKHGQMNGSFIRTGDGDHRMSQYEIDRFIENQHRAAQNDSKIVPDATMADLDRDLVSRWLIRVRATSLGRSEVMSDEDLLANRRVVACDRDGTLRPTVAGIFALGKYPQKFFPRLNVVFTRYPTPKKGELGTSGARFTDAVNIDGPIPMMVLDTVKAVSRNMKHGAIVKGALREDVPDYPLPAIREGVANALMHRDYSPDGMGTPVMVDLYPDRLEICNPGGLFGSLTVDKLGTKGGTASRNQFLARILEDVPYTDFDGRTGQVVENRGSGYPTIEHELKEALLGRPIIQNSLDEFALLMRHRRMTEEEGSGYTKANVEEAIIAFCAERGSAKASEVANAAGISPKTARKYINALLDQGVLEAIGTKNSPERRYRLSV